MMIKGELAAQVRGFLENGDRAFLTTLAAGDRNDVESQAVVRYLLQIKHWPMTPDSEFSAILNHLFAEFPERRKIIPEEYQATTFQLIKNTFDYECVLVVPEPRAPREENKPKTRAKTRKTRTTGDDDEVQEAVPDLDTSGASDRLKKVIAIQRGG